MNLPLDLAVTLNHSRSVPKFLPLPGGEGRGEGKRKFQPTRKANPCISPGWFMGSTPF